MSNSKREIDELLVKHNVYFWKVKGKTVHLSDKKLRKDFVQAISELIVKAKIEELESFDPQERCDVFCDISCNHVDRAFKNRIKELTSTLKSKDKS